MAAFPPTLFTSVVLMVTTAIALSGCSVSVDVGDTERRVETESVAVDGITTLALTTDNGALQISGDDVAEIQIETTFTEPERGDATSAIDIVGDSVHVTGECDSSWYERCSVSYRIVLPAILAVELETDNGRIELSDVAGRIDVSSDNGAIEAERLLSTDVRAHTDNGRIDLGFTGVPGSVEVRSDNGRVEVAVPDTESGYAVDADSDNGDVDVDVTTDPAAPRTILAHSDNGAVTIRRV